MENDHTIEDCVSQDRIDGVCQSTFDENWVHKEEVMKLLTFILNGETIQKPKYPAVPATFFESRVISEVLAKCFIPKEYKIESLESSSDIPISSAQPFQIRFHTEKSACNKYNLITVTADILGSQRLYDAAFKDDRSKKYGAVTLTFSDKKQEPIRQEILNFYKKLEPISQEVSDENIAGFADAVTSISELYSKALYVLAASSGVINAGTKDRKHPELALLRPEDEAHPENAANVPVYVARKIMIRDDIFSIGKEPVQVYLNSRCNIMRSFPQIDKFPTIDVSIAAFQCEKMLYYLDAGIAVVPKILAAKRFMNRA